MKAGEGDDRGQNGCMASLSQWHEFEQALGDVKRGKPCVLQPMGLQTVGHNLVTEQQQIQEI